jgi:hypothetical protein
MNLKKNSKDEVEKKKIKWKKKKKLNLFFKKE